MSATPMTFDKDWTNPADFPTHETQESQVRADIQYLFNAIKTQFNNFIANEFTASNESFAPTSDINVSNVQAAIEFVYSQILAHDIYQVADGSVITDKLADLAVTSAKIALQAITTALIADNAVTSAKLADGAITAAKFADATITLAKMAVSSVGTDQLVNNCVTSGKLANKSVTTQRIDDLAVTADKLAAAAVTTAKILDLAVTTAKLANGAVTTDKIDALAVTTAKLADAPNGITEDKINDGAVSYAKTTGIQKKHAIVGPITITGGTGEGAWDSETLSCSITVSGVSLSAVATQRVDWTPASDADWVNVQNFGVRAVREPTADNTVTMKCYAIPSADIDVYFCIFD